MLAQAEEDLVQVLPAVELACVVDAVQQIRGAGNAYRLGRERRELTEPAVFPEGEGQQRRRQGEAEGNQGAPVQEEECQQGRDEEDRVRWLDRDRVARRHPAAAAGNQPGASSARRQKYAATSKATVDGKSGPT